MIKSMLKRTFINDLYIKYKENRFKSSWKKQNKENFTVANTIFNPELVEIGKATYGELNVIQFANIHKLVIGSFVSIAQEVTFILDAEHYTNHVSTYPYKVKFLQIEKEESFGKGDIIVDDDVWIGYRATIMSGVHIGQGAIISAGSIVTKDVPPYAIVGGVPAKVIKYRFSDELRKLLVRLDFSKFDKNFVNLHINELYQEIKSANDFEKLEL